MAASTDRGAPEIEPGVTVADLDTVERCDRALDHLMIAIAKIEGQLASASYNSVNRRFSAWADIHRHSEMVHGTAPTLVECDLVLRAERRRLAAEGCPNEDLPVTTSGQKAVSHCEREAGP